MPLNNGQLTTKERSKFATWLNEKGKSHKCPVCGENDWAIGAHLLQVPIYIPNIVTMGGASYPLAFIVCNNCAYTRKFMALEIGLIEKNGEVGEEDG